jgi:hypothetical protein
MLLNISTISESFIFILFTLITNNIIEITNNIIPAIKEPTIIE